MKSEQNTRTMDISESVVQVFYSMKCQTLWQNTIEANDIVLTARLVWPTAKQSPKNYIYNKSKQTKEANLLIH